MIRDLTAEEWAEFENEHCKVCKYCTCRADESGAYDLECDKDMLPKYNEDEEAFECDGYREIDEFEYDRDDYEPYNPYLD